jgi:outer membrane immunogenic protein
MDFIPVAGAVIPGGCSDRSGGLIGGQLGYRWQTGGFVFGLEGQGDWADLSSSRVSLINAGFTTRTRVDGLGLFTGQIGYGWNATLLYLKGGAAVTGNSFDILTNPGNVSVASASATRWVQPWVSEPSTASHQTGRSVLNTTTCSWATRTIRSPSRTPSLLVRSIA